jgi:hypothetical protein
MSFVIHPNGGWWQSTVLPLTAWVSMFYFMKSATTIIFSLDLYTLQGGGDCEKEYSLYACDNDEKDGRPQTDHLYLRLYSVGAAHTK